MTRPRVVLFNGATLDGRIAASPDVPAWLDDRWRALAEIDAEPLAAVLQQYDTKVHLEGSSSFVGRAAPERFRRYRGPRTDLHTDFWFDRSADERDFAWMVVPDSGGRVAWRPPSPDDGANVVVLVVESTPPEYLAELREKRIRYLVVPGDQHVDLASAVERVGEWLDTDTVVSTAGGILNGVLLRLGLVDEICVSLMPAVLGVATAPALFEGYGLGIHGLPARLTLLDAAPQPDGRVVLRYSVDADGRPSATPPA